MPLVLWASVLAGPWLISAADSLRGLPRAASGAIAALLVLLLPRVYQQISPMVPELSPLAPPPSQATRSLPSARLGGVVEDWLAVGAWLAQQPDRGRVLVQYAPLGEYLRWASDRPILGGFHDRRMIFQDANLFYFPVEDPRYTTGLAEYLERYNVSHVIMTYPYLAEIERRSDLLAAGGIHGGLHRVYTVKQPGGYFMTGAGRVEAAINRITVRDATPAPGGQSLVLRYHWMDELRCSPDCTVRRFAVEGDTAGFIEVTGAPNLPREFAVELEY